jgi:hypothetical protein
VVLTIPAEAQHFFSWHVFDTGVTLKPGLDLVLHQRTRTATGNPLDQIRGGPILRYRVHPKAIVYGGYYYQPQHSPDDFWIKGHRFFTGVETSRSVAGRSTLTGRVAVERYRSYLRLLIGSRRVAPYLQNEVIAVRHGFHSSRSSGGLRIRVVPTVFVEVGGLYDFRQTEWGGDRAAIVTGLRWNPGAR